MHEAACLEAPSLEIRLKLSRCNTSQRLVLGILALTAKRLPEFVIRDLSLDYARATSTTVAFPVTKCQTNILKAVFLDPTRRRLAELLELLYLDSGFESLQQLRTGAIMLGSIPCHRTTVACIIVFLSNGTTWSEPALTEMGQSVL